MNIETITVSEWYGLYNDSWQGEIVPEAFSHPAKYGRAMIRQIYRHMIDSGYIVPGDDIVDPFGGVALGALDAMRHGLNWHGCELEPRFVELGNQNLGLWQARYSGWFAKWGTAVLHQGDSRQLGRVIGAASGCISSPPFENSNDHERPLDSTRNKNGRHSIHLPYGSTPGQLGSMPAGDFAAAISSPPYASNTVHDRNGIDLEKTQRPGQNSQAAKMDGYGKSDGQLSNMPAGDFAAAISSPPYGDAVSGQGEGPGARHDTIGHKGDNAFKISSQPEYGRTPGNLGNLRMDAAVSSPPFEDGSPHNGGKAEFITGKRLFGDYGSTTGDIGNDTGASFWTAARDIVEQVYDVLKPGGYCAWVTGDFVRKGKRVLFGQQWLELCTAVGFEPVEWIICWKTQYKGSQLDIFGDTHHKQVDRVSFFRRLANEKNPDNAILNEDIIIVRKPL